MSELRENAELNELIDSLLQVVNIDDEVFDSSYDDLKNEVEKMLSQTQVSGLVDQIISEFHRNNSSITEVTQTGKDTLEVFFNLFYALKNSLTNPNKKEFVDIVYAFIEEIFVEVLEKYEPNKPLVYIQKLNPNATIPTYAHDDDQGADVYACEDVVIEPHTYGNMIHTGIALAIPSGWAVGVRARSGMSRKTTLRLSNCYGTIDTSYKDEVCVLFDNIGDEPVTIHAGDRIAQLIMERSYNAVFTEVENVKAYGSDRNGGFGSSGN